MIKVRDENVYKSLQPRSMQQRSKKFSDLCEFPHHPELVKITESYSRNIILCFSLVFLSFFLDACFLVKQRKKGYGFGRWGESGAVAGGETVIRICMGKKTFQLKKQ